MSGDALDEKEAPVRALDEDDIALLKTYGLGPYASRIKDVEKDIKAIAQKVNDICGVKESDTGLAPPSRWDLVSDKQTMQEEQPLQVRITFSLPSIILNLVFVVFTLNLSAPSILLSWPCVACL
jgi:hypothetical protein